MAVRRTRPKRMQSCVAAFTAVVFVLFTATPSRAMIGSALAKIPDLVNAVIGKREAPPVAVAVPNRDQLWAVVRTESARYGLSPSLVWGLIDASSKFDHRAKSPKGAIGYMQVMPETAELLGIADIGNPYVNVSAGTQYLHNLVQSYGGNVELAIAAYRFGPGSISKGSQLTGAARDFVDQVLRYSAQAQNLPKGAASEKKSKAKPQWNGKQRLK